jgi:hypothetical protein
VHPAQIQLLSGHCGVWRRRATGLNNGTQPRFHSHELVTTTTLAIAFNLNGNW